MRIRRIAAMFAVMASMVGLAPAAQAVEYWIIYQPWSDACLDHNFAQGVHMRTCNYGPHQRWQLFRHVDGSITFMNMGTKMCLDNSEHGVRGWGCNELNYQRWVVKNWDPRAVEFVSRYNNHCLDNSVLGVRTVGCNGLPFQRWLL